MRVAVTGGAGFVGSHVCMALAEAGHDPVIVDNFANAKPDVPERTARIVGRELPVHELDIRDEHGLDELFAMDRFDSVVHCAALKAVGDSVARPLEYYDANVSGTITLMRVMGRHDVRSILFSSSATVYGDPDEVPVTEESEVGRATNP